jgi:phosphonate transport system substrate-binding protein
MAMRIKTVSFLRNSALLCSCVLFLCTLLLPAPGFGAVKKYILAVVPSVPPVATYTTWTPFVEALSKETALDIQLKVYEKMSDFEADFNSGTPDFIFLSPTQTVLARAAQGYIPLIRGSKLISGVLFVRKDSPYKTLKDLEGKEIAFVGSRNL